MFLTTNNNTTKASFLFTLLAGAQLLTQTSGQEYVLDVEEEYEYGAPITVSFEYPADTEPQGSNFIGLYNIRKKNGNLNEYMWSDTCGSQKSWDDPDLCDPPASGSVTFTAEDPSHEVNGWQWALPKGNYKACLVDYLGEDAEDEYVDLACTDFVIKKIPNGWRCKTSIIPHKTFYGHDGRDSVSFSFVGLPILNTWVGVYSIYDIPTEKYGVIEFEPISWTYAGCDSRDGDQEENNDCSVAVEHGTKTFDMSDYPDDEYLFCIVYDNNSPYREFKCSSVVVFET